MTNYHLLTVNRLTQYHQGTVDSQEIPAFKECRNLKFKCLVMGLGNLQKQCLNKKISKIQTILKIQMANKSKPQIHRSMRAKHNHLSSHLIIHYIYIIKIKQNNNRVVAQVYLMSRQAQLQMQLVQK